MSALLAGILAVMALDAWRERRLARALVAAALAAVNLAAFCAESFR